MTDNLKPIDITKFTITESGNVVKAKKTTDEELAKGWVTDNTGFNPKEPLGKIAVRTFLAGLRAGRDMAETDLATIAYMQGAERYKTQWHDLRKNPNDLPDNGRRVLVKDKSRREYDIACLCRSKGGSDFWSYERFSTKVKDNYVVAWCDFPRFEE